ncbi:MAG: hypothetical protein ACXWV0_10370 [Flavisolibacter sp.]
MKTISFILFMLCCMSIGLNAQDKSCPALKKLVNDLPNNFKNVKAEYESDFDGTKQYGLKIMPEGWSIGNLIQDGKKLSIFLMADSDENEEDGKERFNAFAKSIAACLSLTGVDDTNSFGHPTLTFTKGNARIILLLTPIDDKYNTSLTIEKIQNYCG